MLEHVFQKNINHSGCKLFQCFKAGTDFLDVSCLTLAGLSGKCL